MIHILENITDIKSKSIRCIPTKVISVVYMLILCLKDPKQGVGIVLPNWNIFHQKQLLTGPWYVIFVKAISQTTSEFCFSIHISTIMRGHPIAVLTTKVEQKFWRVKNENKRNAWLVIMLCRLAYKFCVFNNHVSSVMYLYLE